MAIKDRLAKLEGRQGTTTGMTAAEIEDAAAEFRRRMDSPAERGIAGSVTPEQFRQAIINTRDPWLQRTFAAFHPLDFDL